MAPKMIDPCKCIDNMKLILSILLPLCMCCNCFVTTLVTRIEDPWLLLATLPLFHPVQALKMTPLLQFTPIHFPKSTPLPLFTTACNLEALLGSVAGKFRSICKLLALFVFALPSQTCKLASLVCLDFNFFYPSIFAIRVASFS